jgi:hypothetical protein
MSRWSEYREKNGVTPLDMLNPQSKKVEQEVADRRLDICKSCPELVKITQQCKKCGCFMTAKTKYEAAKCPLGKW